MRRWGMTIPLETVPLAEHRAHLEEMVALGYTDFWSAEASGADGFTPLALASVWAPAARLGIAVVPVYTRGPALLAMSAATLAEAAPGRFALGIGTSSQAIVERWNGIPFEKPYARVRDTLRFLRRALAGEKVSEAYETFRVDGFRLGRPPATPPEILLAALRPGMLRLAGREADGAILNFLSADDVRRVVAIVHEAAGDAAPRREIVARIFVCPTPNAVLARAIGRRLIAAYLTVPVYAAFHEWLGRGDALRPLWDAWNAGDRKGAVDLIPDEVVDALLVHGAPAECRAHVERYVANGITTPALALIPFGGDLREAIRALAPQTSGA
jgi:probable F420-dependent oxidoreductase